LSGGQRQRIALGAALGDRARILLLDEPFGALDAKVRKELRQWLRSLHSENPRDFDLRHPRQEEALEVANRVVVMDRAASSRSARPARCMTIRPPLRARLHR